MHELSIAGALVDVATRYAAGRPVTRVEVKVGHLRQVVPSALEFAWELLVEGTPLEGAELAMEEMPATVHCKACGSEATLTAFPARCAACGSFSVEVTGGEELLVDALEIDEQIPIGSGG
jgi:hydrogenase nickel incorporation protein HypA/HybF